MAFSKSFENLQVGRVQPTRQASTESVVGRSGSVMGYQTIRFSRFTHVCTRYSVALFFKELQRAYGYAGRFYHVGELLGSCMYAPVWHMWPCAHNPTPSCCFIWLPSYYVLCARRISGETANGRSVNGELTGGMMDPSLASHNLRSDYASEPKRRGTGWTC